jgi:DNA mismatch repair protein MutS2
LEEAHNQAEDQLQALQAEMAEIRKALARARQPAAALEEIEEQVETLEETIEQPISRQELDLGPALANMEDQKRRSIHLGDKVRLRTLGTQGVVSGLSEDEAEVQVGVLRVRTKLSDLELSGGSANTSDEDRRVLRPDIQQPKEKAPRQSFAVPKSPGIELDLRGQRADEAITALERYIEAAYMAGLPYVRIIHGKGTGKLRDVVRQTLSGHPQVRSYEAGGEREGGDGVTIAKLSVG